MTFWGADVPMWAYVLVWFCWVWGSEHHRQSAIAPSPQLGFRWFQPDPGRIVHHLALFGNACGRS